ncbi:MAG: efflux RND transporter periplasmic adaptor subunit [Pseudomonadota bacterium]
MQERFRLAKASFLGFAALWLALMDGAQADGPSPLVTGSIKLPDSETLARDFLQGQMQGVIVPTQYAKLAARRSGTIISIGPDNGESFSAGDVLVAFDCRRAQVELAQVEAKLDGARARHEVQTKRVDNGSAGSLKLVEADVLLREAKAEMMLAKQAIEECQIIAPFDGVVDQRIANPHETVNVRDALLNVVATKGHEVRAYVPAVLLRSVSPGDAFKFMPHAGADEPLVGTIVAFGARVDNVSRLIEVRGRFDDLPDHIRPGASGRLEFERLQAAQ